MCDAYTHLEGLYRVIVRTDVVRHGEHLGDGLGGHDQGPVRQLWEESTDSYTGWGINGGGVRSGPGTATVGREYGQLHRVGD